MISILNGYSSMSPPRPKKRSKLSPIRVFLVALMLIALQVVVNVVLYLNIQQRQDVKRQELASMRLVLDKLQYQVQELADTFGNTTTIYQDDGIFFPFSIRDARRLTPVQIPRDFHVFDYIDTSMGNQRASRTTELWHNAHFVAKAPCHRYMILCYKQKIVQVFEYLLHNTTADYFFYMEADNELCVPLEEIRALAYRHQRYFIGCGIGFSGWIMHRQFVQDFLEAYKPPHLHNNESPDPIGARLLMEKKAWTVTRQYLVSHSTKQGLGAPSLTIGAKDKKTGRVKEIKHLPKCFEPKRTIWYEHANDTEDMHGWDFFNADDCPPTAEIYPCRDDQYVNVTYGVKDMLKFPPGYNQTKTTAAANQNNVTAAKDPSDVESHYGGNVTQLRKLFHNLFGNKDDEGR